MNLPEAWSSQKAVARCLATLVLLAGMARAADTPTLDPKQVYVKKATWAETMIATRANCAEWVKASKPKDGKLDGTPIPAVWAKIHADWREPCAWFRQDLPGVRYLDWFLHAGDTSFERWILRTLPQLGEPGASLQREFEELGRAKAAPSDPRWLELYGRAKRLEEFLAATSRLWLGDLRKAFESQAMELLRSGAPWDDPRWASLKRWAGQCADPGPVAHVGSVAELRGAIEGLAVALPNRFAGGETLLNRLAEDEPRWHALTTALMACDEKALSQLPKLYEEVRAFRRAVLLALRGMPEFLAATAHVNLEVEWERQFETLRHDLGKRAHFAKVAGETSRPEALVLESDRDPADIVLRRTSALLADLRRAADGTGWERELRELGELEGVNARIKTDNAEARYVLFAEACRLRRQIAFRNPLLSFDKLLFLKRHLAIFNHMCDQYYGMAARPGGGLYVLSNPFGPNPAVRGVLAKSVVQRGRLKGQKLTGGPNRTWNIRYDGMGNLLGDETEG
ncbi:MAG: hypothetical protein FJ272_20735, partial [Planctomycetes bacterium]|nr:hypothetical protein [Planctomycetota bacterium]